eukprot:1531099-Prymnesium_polylepis.2
MRLSWRTTCHGGPDAILSGRDAGGEKCRAARSMLRPNRMAHLGARDAAAVRRRRRRHADAAARQHAA